MTPTDVRSDSIQLLADGLALIYHEARHVRHLIRALYLKEAGWEKFSHLASNRVEAWQVIQYVRAEAAQSSDPERATRMFEKRFEKNLDQLLDLYQNPNWRHASAVGGHAWRGVTEAVAELAQAIGSGPHERLRTASANLVNARHNNGDVRDKVRDLDRSIGSTTSAVWGNFKQAPA